MKGIVDLIHKGGSNDQGTATKRLVGAQGFRPKLLQTSEWFSGDISPALSGWYEQYLGDNSPNRSESCMRYWDGFHWRRAPDAQEHDDQFDATRPWRGLAFPAEQCALTWLKWDHSGARFAGQEALIDEVGRLPLKGSSISDQCRVFEEGLAAFRNRIHLVDSPYPSNWQQVVWCDGWQKGAADDSDQSWDWETAQFKPEGDKARL